MEHITSVATPTSTRTPTRTPTVTTFTPTLTPTRTPGVSLMRTFMPPSSTDISASDVLVTWKKNSRSSYTCISGNLDSTNCKTTSIVTPSGTPDMPNAAASKCLAVCPTNADSVIAYKDSNGWKWTGDTGNMTGITNAKNMIQTPIVFNSPSNSSSCYIVNAESPNCPTVNSFGCQAYCMASPSAPSASGFIIEQRCPNNAKSCDPMTLKWTKK